jgi:hypothetical protein
VLLKIITLMDSASHDQKLHLINEISNATNAQTPVLNADRFANDSVHLAIQRIVYDRYGLLYERKRGEFSDGLLNGYVEPALVIERNHFLRLYYSSNGKINRGIQKKLFQKNFAADVALDDMKSFDRMFLGLHVFRYLVKKQGVGKRVERETYIRVYIYAELFADSGLVIDDETIKRNLVTVNEQWRDFMDQRRVLSLGGFRKTIVERSTGEAKVVFNEQKYLRSGQVERDVIEYFQTPDLTPPAPGPDDLPPPGKEN